ncbi:MAG: HAD-IA family hydrolase [Peptococcaceae bacterium]|nr:HAD-IA family hydrolase [Peptococcaceae bacterium]
MALKAVLFDLDGTLLDSIPLIEKTYREVFRQMNLPWNNGAVLKTIGIPLWDACQQFGGARAEELFNRYIEYQRTIHDQYIKVFPETVETLAAIKKWGLKVGVVTSKRREMTERGMRVTGIDHLVDITVTKDDVQAAKPNPEPLLTALDLLGVKAQEAVYVGDSYYDIQAGKAAGITTIGVTWGAVRREDMVPFAPDYLVDSWAELRQLLAGMKY